MRLKDDVAAPEAGVPTLPRHAYTDASGRWPPGPSPSAEPPAVVVQAGQDVSFASGRVPGRLRWHGAEGQHS